MDETIFYALLSTIKKEGLEKERKIIRIILDTLSESQIKAIEYRIKNLNTTLHV